MLVFILCEIILLSICVFPLKKLASTGYRIGFYIVNAFLLLCLSFYLNTTSIFVDSTIQVMKSFTKPIKLFINTYVYPNQYFNPELIKSNFILIDVSGSLDLVNKRAGFDGEPVTNRKKLTELLIELEKNKNSIGTIVCDIKLQQSLLSNPELLNVVTQLSNDKKILMIADKDDENLQKIKARQIPVGWVNYELSEDYVFYTPIKVSDTETLPYSLYSSMTGSHFHEFDFTKSIGYEWTNNATLNFVYPNFVPEMYFSEEDIAQNSSTADGKNQTLIGFLGLNKSGNNFPDIKNYTFNLNDLLDNKEFLSELVKNDSYNKPIVFIGGFNQAESDVHSTAFGKMHGSLILINIYNSFLNGQHIISIWYIIFLYLCFFVLSRFALKKVYKYYIKTFNELKYPNSFFTKYFFYMRWTKMKRSARSLFRHKQLLKQIENNSFIIYCYFIVEAFVDFFFDSKIYIALLLIVLLVDILFNHVLNILGLAIYLLVFINLIEKIIKYEGRLIRKKKVKNPTKIESATI